MYQGNAAKLFFSVLPPQPQLRVVHLRLHGGGLRHRLSGALGSGFPLQSRRLHRGEISLRAGTLRHFGQVMSPVYSHPDVSHQPVQAHALAGALTLLHRKFSLKLSREIWRQSKSQALVCLGFHHTPRTVNFMQIRGRDVVILLAILHTIRTAEK